MDASQTIGVECVAGAGKTAFLRNRLREQAGKYVVAAEIVGSDVTLPGLLCIDDVSQRTVGTAFSEVLAERHRRGLRTVLAGRDGVMRALRVLPPTEVALLGYPALRLDDADVGARLRQAGASDPEAAQLVRRCDGWAAAITFAEGHLADAGRGWDLFWAYAREHVLDPMGDAARADFMTIACTAEATTTGFASESKSSLFDAETRLRALPFVTIDERGRVRISPIALAMLRAVDPGALLVRARSLAATRTQPKAAIATLLRGGDLDGAAQRAEQSIEVVPALDAESHELLGELPQIVLRSHPRLWLGVGMPRWWHDDPRELIDGATAALEAASRADIDTRFGLTLMLLGAWIGEGQRERAATLVRRLVEDARTSATAPHHPILAEVVEAAWRTFDERDFDIDAVRDACSPLFVNASIYFVYLVMPLWTWQRIHGRPAEAHETCEKALSVAQELMPGSYVDALAGAIYTAWLTGATERLEELRTLHREVVEAHHFSNAHGFFVRAAAGDPASDEARAFVRPWFLAEGLLMRASLREDAAWAQRDIDEAIVIAKRIGCWEMALTGFVALASFDDEHRAEHLREAATLAGRVGTSALHDAVDELVLSDGRNGLHYQPVVDRFARFGTALRLGLLERTVALAGKPVRVTRQQFAILALIALSPAPIPRRELGELISSDGALVPERVLEVQLARLRHRLGRDAIVHDGEGYRFGIPFTTDWHAAHRALQVAHNQGAARDKLAAIAAAVVSAYERSTALRAAESRIVNDIQQGARSVR